MNSRNLLKASITLCSVFLYCVILTAAAVGVIHLSPLYFSRAGKLRIKTGHWKHSSEKDGAAPLSSTALGMGHCQLLQAWRGAPKIHTKPSTETEPPYWLHLTSKSLIFFSLPPLANKIVPFTAERGHKLIDLSLEFISINSKLLAQACEWKEAHISAVPLVCSLSTLEMSWESGKEAQKQASDTSDIRRQRKWLFYLKSQSFPGKLRLRETKVKGKSQGGKCQLGLSSTNLDWMSYSRSYTKISSGS